MSRLLRLQFVFVCKVQILHFNDAVFSHDPAPFVAWVRQDTMHAQNRKQGNARTLVPLLPHIPPYPIPYFRDTALIQPARLPLHRRAGINRFAPPAARFHQIVRCRPAFLQHRSQDIPHHRRGKPGGIAVDEENSGSSESAPAQSCTRSYTQFSSFQTSPPGPRP